MNNLLRLEEVAQFGLALFLFMSGENVWWVFFAWLLAPDISMIGYIAGPKVGAWLYNFVHHKALAVASFVAGHYFNIGILVDAGLILFAHSSMDRVFGYGLKYADFFGHTHLGWIGKQTEQN